MSRNLVGVLAITAIIAGCGDGSGPNPVADRIAFTAQIGINFEIYVMNADGSDLVPLTSTPDLSPAWRP